jgi:two-component system C4-dicarboxylate transport sensor histidine kinase DctB
MLASLLQRDVFVEQLRSMQGLLLVGQLTSSLLHELRNKLNRLELQAQLLSQDCMDLVEGPPMVSAARLGTTLKRRAERIALTNLQLRDLTHQYLGLIGREELKEVDINDLIRSVLKQIAPLAEDAHVEIETRFDTPHLVTTTIPLRLEQVLLNVVMNGVQMMAQEGIRGRIEIKSQRDIRDQRMPIKLRVKDTGPGIHRRQWGWIFEMGTSTRDEGTGLGLFVSKGLMESLAGRISVEQSYVFTGTTFLIELPVMTGEAM